MVVSVPLLTSSLDQLWTPQFHKTLRSCKLPKLQNEIRFNDNRGQPACAFQMLLDRIEESKSRWDEQIGECLMEGSFAPYPGAPSDSAHGIAHAAGSTAIWLHPVTLMLRCKNKDEELQQQVDEIDAAGIVNRPRWQPTMAIDLDASAVSAVYGDGVDWLNYIASPDKTKLFLKSLFSASYLDKISKVLPLPVIDEADKKFISLKFLRTANDRHWAEVSILDESCETIHTLIHVSLIRKNIAMMRLRRICDDGDYDDSSITDSSSSSCLVVTETVYKLKPPAALTEGIVECVRKTVYGGVLPWQDASEIDDQQKRLEEKLKPWFDARETEENEETTEEAATGSSSASTGESSTSTTGTWPIRPASTTRLENGQSSPLSQGQNEQESETGEERILLKSQAKQKEDEYLLKRGVQWLLSCCCDKDLIHRACVGWRRPSKGKYLRGRCRRPAKKNRRMDEKRSHRTKSQRSPSSTSIRRRKRGGAGKRRRRETRRRPGGGGRMRYTSDEQPN